MTTAPAALTGGISGRAAKEAEALTRVLAPYEVIFGLGIQRAGVNLFDMFPRDKSSFLDAEGSYSSIQH